MSHNIIVAGGTSVRLPTAGKYCDRDIVITATGSEEPPENLDQVLSEQEELIAALQETLKGKMAGGGSVAEYTRVGYIQFTGKQTVDTGIICNQNTKIRVVFTRESSASVFMFGVSSSGNTASVTAYFSSGGAWRFGDKSASATLTVDAELVHTAIVDKTGILRATTSQSFSGVNSFETIGTLTLGSCRNASGTLGAAQFVGKIFAFEMWQENELVLNLLPAVNKDGVYGFYDNVSKTFFQSVTDTPLEGESLLGGDV